jgi:glycerol kinase
MFRHPVLTVGGPIAGARAKRNKDIKKCLYEFPVERRLPPARHSADMHQGQKTGEAGMTGFVLAIDQGTTSSRAILFRDDFTIAGSGQQEFPQLYPRDGWVEHDPEAIWSTTVETVRKALAAAEVRAGQVAAIGITNQRETTIVWERASGKPIHNAIVWQDRRTAEACAALKAAGLEAAIAGKTGLLLDPYFSGTKIAWILDHVPGARARAEAGELCFGTVDSFLLWRLTGGRVHATDATNASRTMLLDIHAGRWDDGLLDLLRVPRAMLPEVKDCAADFGSTDPALFGAAIPICGIAGDQQAATVGQACFQPGMMKSTYGTGTFALINTGGVAVPSKNRLLTTIAYQLEGQRTYALEGSIFVAGAAVQWLRDGIGIIESAAETGPLAAQADPTQNVVMVPAFVGLGAPYWDAEARGAIFGLTRGTGPKELARAALESVCFQTHDLVAAMRADWQGAADTVLRVDGGMVASDWTMQHLADILGAPVDRPEVLETTALGAAYLAGYRAGVFPPPAEFARRWRLERRFAPAMREEDRNARLALWKDAIRRVLTAAR